MSVDELVSGALESSFWAMDRLILRDKETHRITGGATGLVALFIAGKVDNNNIALVRFGWK